MKSCRGRSQRLEADFPDIADVIAHSRQTFGKWRGFEQGANPRAR